MNEKDIKERIVSLVKFDLTFIEEALKENLNPYYGLTAKVAEHILFSGGKRLRPLLAVLSAKICGYKDSFIYPVSIAFEYLHTATLLHDDLVDGGEKRRGKKAAHTIWDNSTVILVGDFLLARALSMIADTNKPKLTKLIADITQDMSQGEIMQLDRIGNTAITESEYMDVIYRKTAVLIKGACTTGGVMAEAGEEKISALTDFGENVGLAFQMADDLLDYTADSKVLGKNVGADLREGKITLPVIYALKHASSEESEYMRQVISKKELNEEDFKKLNHLIDKLGGIGYTRQMAVSYIDKAKKSLEVFAPSEAGEVLNLIADYALLRKK